METENGRLSPDHHGERVVASIGGLQCLFTKEPLGFKLQVEQGTASAAVESAILTALRKRALFGTQVDRSAGTITLHNDIARIGSPALPELDWKMIVDTLPSLAATNAQPESLYPPPPARKVFSSEHWIRSVVEQAAVTAAEFMEKECRIRLSDDQRSRLLQEMKQSLCLPPRPRR